MAPERTQLPLIVFCIGGLERGGSESQLVALAERLHGVTLEASVVTFADVADPELRDRLRRAGVQITTLHRGGGPRVLRVAAVATRLGLLLARRRPAAIYAWLEEAALLSAPVAWLTRTPFMVARRNILGPYAERSGAIVRAIHFAERRARVVTVNSRAVGDVALARGVPGARIRLVANGHAVAAEPGLPPDDEIVIGYVARFRSEKGHRRLLDALTRMRTDVPWRVDLAGDGPLQQRIADETVRLGLQDRVRFVGRISDARSFWVDRHIAALLSDHEGSPNALIEAAMSGRPIVATAVGGVPDVVGPDGGTLVPTDDPDATAAAFVALIEDGEHRRRAGRAARRHAVANFAIDRALEGHMQAIREVVGA
jgi:glycosyltransferase involved in cell wall biosynthesis